LRLGIDYENRKFVGIYIVFQSNEAQINLFSVPCSPIKKGGLTVSYPPNKLPIL